MSKENLKKFLEMAEKEEGLKTRIEAAFSKIRQQGAFDEKVSEKIFTEEILPLGKEKGLELDLSDIQYHADGRLSDDALEAVTGGMTNNFGYWKTTVGYSCSLWRESKIEWLAAKGACGSCFYWEGPTDNLGGISCYIGVPGTCKANIEK